MDPHDTFTLSSEQNNPEREQRMSQILETLLITPDEQPDFDRLRKTDPDLVDELQQLWMTATIARTFSDDAPPETSQGAGSLDGQPAVLGDYRIDELIGQGGMGRVYRAYHRRLQRPVAIKVLRESRSATAEDRQRFEIEAQAAARLRHPNIIPVHEVGNSSDQLFFVMQLIEGQTAAAMLDSGPLECRKAVEFLLPVVDAIQHAHDQGVYHRDLKPSNILMDENGLPFVTDFGLAKQLRQVDEPTMDALTLNGAIVGTPGYMAPEQAAGSQGPIGPGADIYGLGAVLYALLTGRAPFQSASVVQAIMRVTEQDPLPPRILNPAIHHDLELIVLKCLQRPIDLRYRSATELAEDLRAFLAGDSISARSSRFSDILSRAFRETHHAVVLQHWGLLWMWHSLVLLVLCLVTNFIQFEGVRDRWPYVTLWTAGLGLWALIFWNLRHRSGPVTFVERQIAHIWAASMCCSSLLFGIEALLGLPVLKLCPVLGLLGGTVFLVKAGILSGRFYLQAGCLYATAIIMASMSYWNLPQLQLTLFGFVSAACFFVPGLKYFQEKKRSQ